MGDQGVALKRRLGGSRPERLRRGEHDSHVLEHLLGLLVLIGRSQFDVGVDDTIPLLHAAVAGEVGDPRLEGVDHPRNIEGRRGYERLVELGEL